MEETYAYVVVGAGSSGAALARRLAERQSGKVLLLEAGQSREKDFWVRAPIGIAKVVGDDRYVWKFRTEKQSSLVDQEVFWPRGRMLGGSSGVNGTIYVRGEAQEYDTWSESGCAGWSYADVLPYFKRLETTAIGDDEFRGRQGPVHISSLASMPDPLSDAFHAACVKEGIPDNPDYNGKSYEGVGYLQLNTKDGKRFDTATAYLGSDRPSNLVIHTEAVAKKVEFDGRRAVAVSYKRGEVDCRAKAQCEVILSAGPIKSPQLLELSGVGDSERLKALGIDVVHHLAGVGENLRDHIQTRITFECTRRITLNEIVGHWWPQLKMGLKYILTNKGFMATPAFTIHALAKTSPGLQRPNVKIQLAHLSGDSRFEMTTGGNPGAMLDNFPGFAIGCFQLRPNSQGYVHISSKDPFAAPAINPNYLKDEFDQSEVVESLKLARRVAAQMPLAQFIVRETRPSANVADDAGLLQYAKESAATSFHPVGTCRMGNDDMAVVDASLRVRGVDGLRVVDSSVMPTIPASNTNSASIMIGEKGADLILGAA